MMQLSDLGLLQTTLVLLDEQHVTRAAARLHLSVSATSRALDRSRRAFADPLLVRQGRNVVVTPRGAQLREEIRPILAAIDGLFDEPPPFTPALVRETFRIRLSEAVLASGGSAILGLTRAEGPGVEVYFDLEAADDIDALRDGSASLSIGSYGDLPGDIVSAHLLDERLVAVVRGDHPCLATKMTMKRFAGLEHLMVSRRGIAKGPIDLALAAQGLKRTIAAVVPSFTAALAMAIQGDQAAIVPQRLAEVFARGSGVAIIPIPIALPTVDVRQFWHHRMTTDPAHSWLRSCVQRAAIRI
jgi:DNA-binding transcriptional LysR family regulator